MKVSFILVNKATTTQYNKSSCPNHTSLSLSALSLTLNTSFSSSIHEAMRETMERFSIGCVSQSSVQVIENQPKKSQTQSNPSPPSGEGEEKMKSSIGLLPLPKPNISERFQRLKKSLSHMFQVYREEDGEVEMEIGFPTDVQHVGHIGWDGSNSVSTMKSWDRAPEFLSLSSLSLRQFELAMAKEEDASL